jgi:phenylpyruvate tautomerase PptA (4-oxalocrotonate tautomerase family)
VPLIDVSALPQHERVRERVLEALVMEVSTALGRPPDSTWVVWRTLDAGSYAVGTARPEFQPEASHPPIVRIYARRTTEEWQRIVAAVERVIQRELRLDPFVIVERADESLEQ